MAQAIIAQKSSEVDTDLQKIGTGMITMFRLGKEEKQTENRLNQDFSQDDNDIEKKKKAAMRALARKRYSTSKIKARNFLTNIAYRRHKKSNFSNCNFVIDVYFFLLQNVNPLMTDKKFDNENDRQCVKMLGRKCLPQQFTRYTFLYDDFLARKRYSTSKIKARNFLTNIAYRRHKKSNFSNCNFVIDVYSFLLQNVNPLMIDRKFDNENDRQCIKMLWQRCLLQQYTRYTFLYGNVLGLTQK